MSDFLLELSKNPQARAVVSALGLPIPLPQPLKREQGPWVARPLADSSVAVGAAPGAELVLNQTAVLSHTVPRVTGGAS
jgi:hypothetical protein